MNLENPEKVGFDPERMNRVNSAIQRYVDEGIFTGLVTLVARKGKVIHLDKFGYQDLESKKPMALDTIFRIYSMTKPITGVAFMMLYEQGLVHLEDPVSKYIPEFKSMKVRGIDGKLVDAKTEMTIHQILTHTSGLDYAEHENPEIDPPFENSKISDPTITLQEMVQRITKRPLIFHPGKKWHYSLATDVVGHIVEIVSGKPIAEFFEENIFKPLGMVDIAFNVPPEKEDRFATLYGHVDGNPLGLIDEGVGGVYSNPALHSPGGGLVSTIVDYFKFAQLLLNKGEFNGVRLLGPKTVEFMSKNHLPTRMFPIAMEDIVLPGPGPGMGFGLCFSVVMDNGLNGTMASNGSHGWGGWASTHFWVDPVEEIIGIIMVQSIPSWTYPIPNDFRTAIYQALKE